MFSSCRKDNADREHLLRKTDETKSTDSVESNGQSLLSDTELEEPETRRLTLEPVKFLYAVANTPAKILIPQLLFKLILEEYFLQPFNRLKSKDIDCGLNNKSDPYYVMHEIIQVDAAYWMLYPKGGVCFPIIIVLLICGRCIHRLSIKNWMLLPILANMTLMIVGIIVLVFNLAIPYLLIGFFAEGFAGSTWSFIITCSVYSFYDERKSKSSTKSPLMDAALLLLGGIANYVVCIVIQQLGFLVALSVVIVLHMINSLYIAISLPNVSRNAQSGDVIPLYPLKDIFSIYVKKRDGSSRLKLLMCMSVFSLLTLGTVSRTTVNILYILNVPFCWNAETVGLYYAILSFLKLLGSGAANYLKETPINVQGVLILSHISAIGSTLIMAFSTYTSMMFIASLVGIFHDTGVPILKSVMSSMVCQNEKGHFTASLLITEVVIDVAGHFLFNTIYAESLEWFLGFVYLTVTGVYVLSLLLTVLLVLTQKLQ